MVNGHDGFSVRIIHMRSGKRSLVLWGGWPLYVRVIEEVVIPIREGYAVLPEYKDSPYPRGTL